MQPPRFAARSRIIYDLTISEGARLLYLALDDDSQGQPSVFEKQHRRSVLMKRTEREIRLRMNELERAGYIRIRRTGRSNVCEFVWKIPEHLFRSDRNTYSDQTGTGVPLHPYRQESLTRTPLPPFGENEKQTPACPECFGAGYRLVERVTRGIGAVERETCACLARRSA